MQCQTKIINNLKFKDMKANLKEIVKGWFNEEQKYYLANYNSCTEWLSKYVENTYGFIPEFFDAEEADDTVDNLREKALAWIEV